MHTYTGVPASTGIVVGPVEQIDHGTTGLHRIVCDPFRERALYDVAVVLAKDSEITADGLGQLMNVSAVRPAAVLPDTPMRPLEPSYPERRAESEREQLIQLLNECRWNISKAAQKMGVARSTLYRKMEHYRLKE